MFCPKCGKELKPGAKFCNGCGASLEGTPQAALDNRSPKPKKGKGAVTVLLLLLAVLLLLGGGAVAAYKLNLFDSFWNPSSEKVHADKDKDDEDMDEEDDEEEDMDDKADEKELDAADHEGEDGKDTLGEEDAGAARNEKHTKINDLPEQDETAAASGYPTQAAASGYPAQTAASGYPAQTAASGLPAETTGAAQAYSDFTAPGVGSGAILETTPATAAAGSDGSYMIMDSSSRRLTASDLYGLSKEQLKIARNEIYARHGRLFDSESLQFYFNSKSWYHGTIAPSAFSEDLLSQVEKDNIKLIKEREASMP